MDAILITLLLLGLGFVCIWVVAWIVAKILTALWYGIRKALFVEAVSVPRVSVSLKQNEDPTSSEQSFKLNFPERLPITEICSHNSNSHVVPELSSSRNVGTPLKCCFLGSGSKGNSCFLQAGDFGVLIDVGLGPRQIANRLPMADANWENIKAVLLTHTDVDHWKASTLRHLKQLRIPIYCHADHKTFFAAEDSFNALQDEGLVRAYSSEEFILGNILRCRALQLCHDGGSTFGFRFECVSNECDDTAALGYVADLGCWDSALAEALSNLDVLALEFNRVPPVVSTGAAKPQEASKQTRRV